VVLTPVVRSLIYCPGILHTQTNKQTNKKFHCKYVTSKYAVNLSIMFSFVRCVLYLEISLYIGYCHHFNCNGFVCGQNEEAGSEEDDSNESDAYKPSDDSEEIFSDEDSDDDYSSLSETDSESGQELVPI